MDLDNTFISYYRKIIEILDKKDISGNLNGCDCYYILK